LCARDLQSALVGGLDVPYRGAGAAHQHTFQAHRFSLPTGFARSFDESLGFCDDIQPLLDPVCAQ